MYSTVFASSKLPGKEICDKFACLSEVVLQKISNSPLPPGCNVNVSPTELSPNVFPWTMHPLYFPSLGKCVPNQHGMSRPWTAHVQSRINPTQHNVIPSLSLFPPVRNGLNRDTSSKRLIVQGKMFGDTSVRGGFTLHPVLSTVCTLKKISVMHVIKLGFAPVSFPPG